jgi:hypothetical protein
MEAIKAEAVSNLYKILNEECINIVSTRGGVHALIELGRINQEFEKSWYKNVIALKCNDFDVMMNSDGLLPIPGCNQGGYIPTLKIRNYAKDNI